MYRFDDFLVDPEAWRLSRCGEEIHLEPLVLELLIYLIAHRGRLVTRQELMDTVWGDTVISESALTKAVARLRQALGDDSATHFYLETVRSRGYRFIATVEEIERQDGPDGPRRTTHAAKRHRFLLTGAAAIALLVILATYWALVPQYESREDEVIASLAVLPLRNLTGDPEQDYYVDALQDLLITELSQLPGLRVTSRQSTIRYRDSQLPTVGIAAELGVDALIEGSLLRDDSRFEVTIQLINGRSDEHFWAGRYTRETPHVFSLIKDMANAIGAAIGATTVSPGAEGLNQEQMGQVDPRAIDAYALGIMHFDDFTPEGIRSAIEQLETAVAIEPKFALAWGQLAAAHAMHGLFGFAQPRVSIEITRAAALKAIKANDQVAIGHSALGWARMWTGDFDGACESFEEALQLNPWAPYAIHGDADCLMLDGHLDESAERTRETLMVSPFGTIHNLPLLSHLYMARRFDAAIAAAKAMQARIPQSSLHRYLAPLYWQQGDFDKALEEARLELEYRGEVVLLAALEEGLNADGPTGAMRAIAEALVVRASKSYVDPYIVGEIFARAGMVDESLHWLNKAVDHGSYENMYIAFRPDFDILHDEPRYKDLLGRIYGRRVQDINRPGNSTPRKID